MPKIAELSECPRTGRLVAIDPGTKFIGVSVSDETQTVARPLDSIKRGSWKDLLTKIRAIVSEFDAKAMVIGLPYGFEGGETEMSAEARRMARNFSLSLEIPVFLQDERVTSYAAKGRLWDRGVSLKDTKQFVDSEAAVIILNDFLERLKQFCDHP